MTAVSAGGTAARPGKTDRPGPSPQRRPPHLDHRPAPLRQATVRPREASAAAAIAGVAGPPGGRRGRARRRCVRQFTRCWPRSATATPSATRCSASSACCARPATHRRSSSRRPIRRLEDLTADYRDLAEASHPDNLLIHHFSHRIAGLAHRLRAAGPDGARLPQHHAARVLRRRAPAARAALLPRTARARCLREPRATSALGDSEFNRAGARSAGLRRTRPCCRSSRTSRTWAARRTSCRPARSTTTGSTSCSSAG